MYTVGNETGGEVNLDNLKAISVLHYRGEKLEHSFYAKNDNGVFENISYLTAFSRGGGYEEVNFAVFYSNIYKKYNNLSAYTILNSAVYNTKPLANEGNPNSDFVASKDLLEKRAMTIGELVSLESTPNQETKEVLGKLYNNYGNRCCGTFPPKLVISIQDIPTPPFPGEGPEENPPMNPEGPCPLFQSRSKTMEQGTSYVSNFDLPLAYEMRDGIMQDSFFGLKYIEYYYNTSFHGCNMDYSDAVKIAILMPKIYNFYSNYKNVESNEIGIDSEMKDEVFSLIESLRQKNSNNANLNIIFDNVKKDVGFLHNKTISEINEVLY